MSISSSIYILTASNIFISVSKSVIQNMSTTDLDNI